MKLLDIILLLLLSIGGYRGFKKGLVFEFFSVLALLFAKLGSTRFVRRIITLLFGFHKGLDSVVNYAVITLAFFLILTAFTTTGKFIRRLIRPTLLGSLDRFLGGIVGIFKWAFCISLCLWIGNLWQLELPAMHTKGTSLFPLVQSCFPQLLTLATAWWPAIAQWTATAIKQAQQYFQAH